jgi:hypothetical protein
MGQERLFERASATSALLPEADIRLHCTSDVRGHQQTWPVKANHSGSPVSLSASPRDAASDGAQFTPKNCLL